MADIIQLLPDSIANQIAAGEVIQRPASVIKELMENAIDAGSTEVRLVIKDAGKTLIQVIDNGCGMSQTDARMSFERHATSKIRQASDLFAIRTMGFRGEALASIAAISHVELRTRQQKEELGTRIIVEGSEVKSQEACQCTAGTSFSVKNLFFNIPARRNFLKSNTVEMRHILEEFQRVAIANSDVFFSLHHNNTEVFHLPSGNLRQRIVGVLGQNCNKKLVPLSEETDILKLEGYVGKPAFAKKTRGEQYFFINNRFIKSAYLNHSVIGAYEDLLPKDTHPLYVIFIDIDPKLIDINVHPTKQEIKFEDDRLIYNYLKVTVRHALGQHSITPTLDFNQETSFSTFQTETSGPKLQSESEEPYNPFSKEKVVENPFRKESNSSQVPASARQENNLKNWEKLYDGLDEIPLSEKHQGGSNEDTTSLTIESKWSETPELDDESASFSKQQKEPYQIHASYIVSQIKSGFLLIDQQAAHERILYEHYTRLMQNKEAVIQKALFAKKIELTPADAAILMELLPEINKLGFDIKDFGSGSFVVQGRPSDFPEDKNEQQVIESLLEQYKAGIDMELDISERIAKSMARSAATRRGQVLSVLEMQELIDKLFACKVPFKSPSGRNCFITYELESLEKGFNA